MAKIFYQEDCNLSLLDGKTIAVIGYGSQGHAHALNAKESGCNVIIGLYEGSKSWAKAEKQGFTVYTAAEAASMVSDGSVTNNPVFNRGYAPMLSNDATEDGVMCSLAKYVPAVSSPVGGSLVLCDVINENSNLNDEKYRNGWGRPAADGAFPWKHSDMKDLSYFYVRPLYVEIVNEKGKLK